ncbi:RNA polymerase sigma factor [Jannaschia pohangensis]|uniref:RNA polymerase sigma factor n=1 Tax=Jannaschia pohangensis TaxID=390807 RepID=UPI001C317A57|nr:RNA polymerase sigma factor [Jannaschia pohangensis]
MTQIDTLSDAQLAQRALGGDRAAFGCLLGRHYDLMYRAAYRWSGRRADAEDVAQDVCIRLPRALRSWSGKGRFETWLYKVVLNAARDQGRKLARDGKLREAWANEPAPDPGCDDEAATRLWEAVRQLPPKQRMAVTLVYGEGVSHAEAAEAMDCAEATVSYHVHAARARLKTLMEEEAA